MKPPILRLLICSSLFSVALTVGAETPAPSPGAGLLVVKTSVKEPNEIVDAVKAYSDQRKWQYVGASKVKNGEVTLVKICIPQVGQLLWPLGLEISAMLPCGNVGIYKKHGKTEISMLHPAYMQLLYPHAQVDKAVKISTPLLLDMMESITQ